MNDINEDFSEEMHSDEPATPSPSKASQGDSLNKDEKSVIWWVVGLLLLLVYLKRYIHYLQELRHGYCVVFFTF